ncbi:LacI family DNA-binding transcriptional regulator [Algoriphagus aestuariicola]|jgi:LacI family transcriptional regulator|uniref:LacI family DNA-binding transcriptional regulator n=1 Tax=Algoriphagus aestuariicola TaxID=1852016 RepID=A0ABS3BXK6_9BACT|nr:LacI family DNA-binding transcriptional regulator [Algoriphagus aestuariicola]MBN7803046.1 LacI family DNA-binding transcriptional regulator [Algoriphagus aestuariicola]
MKNKKATIHEIAAKLNITASTVSRALNNNPRISEETKKRVQKVAKQINYQPNHIASALRSGKSRLIGVIVPTANRNFFSSVIRGIEDLANVFNYKIIISQSYDEYEKEVQNVEALLNARVDGIIASFGKETENFDHFLKVIEKGIPLVLFDRTADVLDVSHVILDDYLGAYQAVDHLIKSGCRRIVHFTNLQRINIYTERKRGYEDALKANGLEVDPALILYGSMQLEDGRRLTEEILEKKLDFDGIFSSADYAIMGALQVLKSHGIAVPGKVKLVGFGNEPFTSFTDPTITTVDQKSIAMGKITAETFFEILNSKALEAVSKKTILKPELIIRESSK